MKIHRTEGIVLRSTPYQDHDQVLTLYTPDSGTLALMVKGARSRRGNMLSAIIPMTRVECVYKEGRDSLALCRELSTLDSFQKLRENYNLLQTGCSLIQALDKSQWPGKPSEKLYQLSSYYLKHMDKAVDYKTPLISFKLKLLRHDGLLHLTDSCLACNSLLNDWYLADGESYCKAHAPLHAIPFSIEEATTLTRLATTRSFSEIVELKLEEELIEKFNRLFSEKYH